MAILFQLRITWIETEQMGFDTWAGTLLVIFGALMAVYVKKKTIQ